VQERKYDPNEKPTAKSISLWMAAAYSSHKAKRQYWHFKYRFNNKQKLISFGVYPEVSLKEARAKRDDTRKCWQKARPSAVKQKKSSKP